MILNDNHPDVARTQMAMLPRQNVVVPPCNRDTGPGLVMAPLVLAPRAPEANLGGVPERPLHSQPGCVCSQRRTHAASARCVPGQDRAAWRSSGPRGSEPRVRHPSRNPVRSRAARRLSCAAVLGKTGSVARRGNQSLHPRSSASMTSRSCGRHPPGCALEFLNRARRHLRGQFLSESPPSTTSQRLRLAIIEPQHGIVASSRCVSVYCERQNIPC